MNATNTSESTALAVGDATFAVGTPMDAASLILGPSFDRVQAFAALMCKGAVTVPQHLRGNPGDCMAVTLAALSRRMDPFAFAQKTHITKSGALGYESQLIKSMILTSGKVEGVPEYEFLGDWSRILGKVEERQSDKGGKYYVATYTKKDEEGLGVTIRWRLRGERAPREMTVMLSQCYPRFSTQWATDPQQQICYVADRKFGRRYTPEVVLGIYDIDELEPADPKFMGPADVVGAPPPPAAAGTTDKPTFPAEKFKTNLPTYTKTIIGGKKTVDEVIATISTMWTLSAEQLQELRAIKPATEATPKNEPGDGTPKATYAVLADRINGCSDYDTALVILDEARSLPADQQKELEAIVTRKFPQE